MVEAVLPTGASIAAFVMAVISWYGVLRAGMRNMYEDIHAARSVKEDILAMREQLESQERSILDWKRQWYVSDDTPESMFHVFWGPPEYQNIKVKLGSMKTHCENAETKLSSFVKGADKKWIARRKLLKRFYKWRFILLEKDHIQQLIQDVSKDLDGIQKAAMASWRRGRPGSEEDRADPSAVYHAGMGHLLVRLALRTKEDANALHSCFLTAQQNFNVELELDLFNCTGSPPTLEPDPFSSFGAVSRETHSAAITAAHKKGSLIWNVLSQRLLSADTTLNRLHLEVVDRPEDQLLNCSTALKMIMEGNKTKCHFKGSDVCFSIEMADTPYQSGHKPCQSLHQLLLKHSHLDGNTAPNENFLGRIPKFKLAFELAQACLLLLRTTWFPQICSCEIQCGRSAQESPEFSYEFRLRMRDSIHGASRARTMNDPWCNATIYQWRFPTKPLRRLGLLLVEIVLGTQIHSHEVANDDIGNVRKVTFVGGPAKVEWVLDRIRDKFDGSRKCESAIRYCLTKAFAEAPTDDEMRKLLAEIYHNVVEP